MTINDISRIYEFIANTIARASEMNAELDQLVEAHNNLVEAMGDLDFTDPTYIVSDDSITDNLEALDAALAALDLEVTTDFFNKTSDTSDDITEGVTNLFITPADVLRLADTSGTNTGDQDLSGYFNKTTDDSDDIEEGSAKLLMTTAERSKLSGIETGAEVNPTNLSDFVNDVAVETIVAGANINVNSTDPRNPIVTAVGEGLGDVVGPDGATANDLAQFSGATGKLIKDGLAVVTTVGTTGSDSNIPTERAIREAIGATSFAYNTQIFVSKDGADTNDGLNPSRPYLAIGAAVSAASSGDIIVVLDSGTYTESVVLVAGVHLYAPYATIAPASGNCIELVDGSRVIIGTVAVPSSGTGILKNTGTALAYADVNKINVIGDGALGALNAGTTGQLYIDVETVVVSGTSSVGIGNIVSLQGHIHLKAGDIYLSGNNSIGIAKIGSASGTDIVGSVEHILLSGSPTNTIGIHNISGTMALSVDELSAGTAVNVVAGEIELMCGKVAGAIAVANGATLNIMCLSNTGTVTNLGTIVGTIGTVQYGYTAETTETVDNDLNPSLTIEDDAINVGVKATGIEVDQLLDNRSEFVNWIITNFSVVDIGGISYAKWTQGGSALNSTFPLTWESNQVYTYLYDVTENNLVGQYFVLTSAASIGAGSNVLTENIGAVETKAVLFTTGASPTTSGNNYLGTGSGDITIRTAILKGDWTHLPEETIRSIVRNVDFGIANTNVDVVSRGRNIANPTTLIPMDIDSNGAISEEDGYIFQEDNIITFKSIYANREHGFLAIKVKPSTQYRGELTLITDLASDSNSIRIQGYEYKSKPTFGDNENIFNQIRYSNIVDDTDEVASIAFVTNSDTEWVTLGFRLLAGATVQIKDVQFVEDTIGDYEPYEESKVNFNLTQAQISAGALKHFGEYTTYYQEPLMLGASELEYSVPDNNNGAIANNIQGIRGLNDSVESLLEMIEILTPKTKEETGTTYTIELADMQSFIRFDNSATITVTVPTFADANIPDGVSIALSKYGTGNLIIAGASGVTINAEGGYDTISTLYKAMSLVKIATDEWSLIGAEE